LAVLDQLNLMFDKGAPATMRFQAQHGSIHALIVLVSLLSAQFPSQFNIKDVAAPDS
jgi:hypothetical protein